MSPLSTTPASSTALRPEARGGPRRGSSRSWLSVRLLGFVAALAVSLAVLLGAPGQARAHEGTMQGWALQDATSQIVVGRAVIRFEPWAAEEAHELADELPGWWAEIERELGRDLDDGMTIHLVSHAGQVARATGMPTWVSGVAHPPRGEIAIALHNPDGSPSDLGTLLRHELVHVALYRATGGAELPRWFHEGVAESVANEVSLMRAEALAGAVFGPGVPPLSRMEAAFHGDHAQAAVAYAAARDFTTWLRYHDVEGAQFRQLLSQLRNGRSFEQSFMDAYEVPLEELDAEWRSGLFGRFVWFPLLGSGSLPFLLVGPVVGFAWFRRKRQLAAAWARMEAEEEAERAARIERAEYMLGSWT